MVLRYDNGLMDSLPLDLARLRGSWLIALRAQRKSAATIRAYQLGTTLFLGAHDELTKATVTQWLSMFGDAEPATARLRLAAVKQFAKWLAAEGELDEDTANAIALIKPPRLDQKPVDAVSDDELRRLIKACAGVGVRDKRDRAMVLLMRDTGLRASELL